MANRHLQYVWPRCRIFTFLCQICNPQYFQRKQLQIENLELLENFRNSGKLPFKSKRASAPSLLGHVLDNAMSQIAHKNGILSENKAFRQQVIKDGIEKTFMDVQRLNADLLTRTKCGIMAVLIVANKVIYFANENTCVLFGESKHSFSPNKDLEESIASIEIKEKTLRPMDKFMVLGSKGLWECVDIELIKEHAGKSEAEQACNKLIMEAVSKGQLSKKGFDSVSAAVVLFKAKFQLPLANICVIEKPLIFQLIKRIQKEDCAAGPQQVNSTNLKQPACRASTKIIYNSNINIYFHFIILYGSVLLSLQQELCN
eukprot:TRINITY_DN1599_c0_g1_i1.p1 TRINITY_DN1599_c0_g1~~TRINITY_DN1599_c0_g1_i1.p1  ORF type:complete len:315 (+),score=8.85 TRINITY_DN1599_c0_g1_i1:737-1681(+)